MTTTATTAQKSVIFIQSDVPPLRTGTYTLTASENVPDQTPQDFAATATFVVQGERFTIAADEITGVFPPALANGEFAGAFAHVVLSRRTLPWERSLRNDDAALAEYPWLAVLVFDDATAPAPTQVTAKDLVPLGTPITVTESTVTGTGTLPANVLSYGASTLVPMGYGETPDEACIVIDVPLATFNAIAPAVDDMQYLAHVRDVTSGSGSDSEAESAVVVGNRIPTLDAPSRAVLVSFENMADYLPQADGTPSALIPAGVDTVRLLAYQSWTYTANDLEQSLLQLLENLNSVPAGSPDTVRLPIVGAAPTAARVQQAAANQALAAQGTGTLTPDDATVIAQNALAMGYVPLNHHLRHGGNTVSWYRGPLAPFPVTTTLDVPIGGPDAAVRYDPEAGLFDVSYGAAWQLGQLLAVQNSGVATAIYDWRQTVRQAQAAAAEQELLQSLLGDGTVFESVLGVRQARLGDDQPALPPEVVTWLQGLATLAGVPFNYLVPDERMLPPESLRFFHLDGNWVDALVDGAFSIGRATTGEGHASLARSAVDAVRDAGTPGPPSGILLRSAAVAGWPKLRIDGFSDAAATTPVRLLRRAQLARDTVLCVFDGPLAVLQIEEPPEQLHMGLENTNGAYWTALRAVDPPNAGQQLDAGPSMSCNPQATEAVACVEMRSDGRTLRVSDAATTIASTLTGDFGQKLADGFTSAEYAMELNQGVLRVEWDISTGTGVGT